MTSITRPEREVAVSVVLDAVALDVVLPEARRQAGQSDEAARVRRCAQ